MRRADSADDMLLALAVELILTVISFRPWLTSDASQTDLARAES